MEGGAVGRLDGRGAAWGDLEKLEDEDTVVDDLEATEVVERGCEGLEVWNTNVDSLVADGTDDEGFEELEVEVIAVD